MSKLQPRSAFKHATLKRYVEETYPLKLVQAPSETSHSISASDDWIAIAYNSTSSLTVLPVEFSQFVRSDNPALISTGSAISDLQFSPWNGSVLATAGTDATVKLWKIPEKGVKESISAPESKVSGLGDELHALRWHPSAANVIASASKLGVGVSDVEKGTANLTYFREGAGKNIVSISWNYDGSLLAALGKDNTLSVFDPRDAKAAVLGTQAIAKLRKAHHALFIGKEDKGKLLIFGQDSRHSPFFELYDPRDLTKAISSTNLNSSPGFTLPAYDHDSQQLYLTTRGSSLIQIYDASDLKTGLQLVTQGTTEEQIRGFATVNKASLRYKDGEINRLFVNAPASVGTYGIVVPKKEKKFHDDLFPNTAGSTPAQSADEYFGGANQDPILVGMEKVFEERLKKVDALLGGVISEAKKASEEGIKNKLLEQKLAEEKALALPKIEDVKYVKSQTRKKLDDAFRGSLYRHVMGKEPAQNHLFWYDIKNDKALYLGRNIAANIDFWATTWQTGGGSAVVVWPLSSKGRVGASKVPLVRGHKTQVTAFDLSPHENQLATTSIDGIIKFFNIPEGGFKDDVDNPNKEINTAGKITYLQYHPYIPEVLVEGSSDFDNVNIRFWDTKTDAKEPIFHLALPKGYEGIDDVSFDTNCKRIAFTTKEQEAQVRIYDVYENKLLQEFQPKNNRRGIQVRWVSENLILVIGVKSGSQRTVAIYDLTDTKTAKKELDVDNSNATMLPYYDPDSMVLWIGSQGSMLVRFFQVSTEAPYLEYLNLMDTKTDALGFAWFQKKHMNVKNVEVARSLKLMKDRVIPIEWTVPRKRLEYFQDDIFPETLQIPVISREEFAAKTVASPNFYSLKPSDQSLLSQAPPEELTERQKRYQEHLVQKDAPKQKGALGHSNAEEVRDHFREVAKVMPSRNRWDAEQDEQNNVDESEWD